MAIIDIDPDKDSIVTAARKLGGINSRESDFRTMFGGLKMSDYAQRIIWAPLIRVNGGAGADNMAEKLHEFGYLEKRCPDEMFVKMQTEITTGEPVYSIQKGDW